MSNTKQPLNIAMSGKLLDSILQGGHLETKKDSTFYTSVISMKKPAWTTEPESKLNPYWDLTLA